ncbi:MAG: hypothetical protein Q8878_06270 [Bacillota bacterium]|nr:hypothetical protein [Bacillota bacterium]
MPVHRTNPDIEASGELSPDIACRSQPHKRFGEHQSSPSNPAKTEEIQKNKKKTKA